MVSNAALSIDGRYPSEACRQKQYLAIPPLPMHCLNLFSRVSQTSGEDLRRGNKRGIPSPKAFLSSTLERDRRLQWEGCISENASLPFLLTDAFHQQRRQRWIALSFEEITLSGCNMLASLNLICLSNGMLYVHILLVKRAYSMFEAWVEGQRKIEHCRMLSHWSV